MKQHLGHRLVAGLISATVAMLFLFLALPLGRQNQAAAKAEPTLRVLPSEEEKAMSLIQGAIPRDTAQAQLWIEQLEPLLDSLAEKAPRSSKAAATAWNESANRADG